MIPTPFRQPFVSKTVHGTSSQRCTCSVSLGLCPMQRLYLTQQVLQLHMQRCAHRRGAEPVPRAGLCAWEGLGSRWWEAPEQVQHVLGLSAGRARGRGSPQGMRAGLGAGADGYPQAGWHFWPCAGREELCIPGSSESCGLAAPSFPACVIC